MPTTADDLYARFEKAITPKTKVFHFCHITNLTGQLFPVQRLSRLARSKGITTIVDGAHAGAHFPFTFKDLDCDTYSVSLHKWLLAPLGTGILIVRKNLIPKFWPLQAAPATSDDNIRKFEEIGTAPMAVKAGIADALAFHRAIGIERKAARLYYLTMRWATPLRQVPKIQMFSSLKPGETWGMATVGIDGMEASKIYAYLFDNHRIIVAPLAQGALPGQQFPYQGVRVTPNVYTTVDEVGHVVQGDDDAGEKGYAQSASGTVDRSVLFPPDNVERAGGVGRHGQRDLSAREDRAAALDLLRRAPCFSVIQRRGEPQPVCALAHTSPSVPSRLRASEMPRVRWTTGTSVSDGSAIGSTVELQSRPSSVVRASTTTGRSPTMSA